MALPGARRGCRPSPIMNPQTETHYHYPQFAIEHRQRKADRSIQLGLIALLICGALGVMLVGYGTSRVMEAGDAVNVGGRQRMLSQRIAKHALLLRDAQRDAVARGQIASAETAFAADTVPRQRETGQNAAAGIRHTI